jgi:hypothetical protein
MPVRRTGGEEDEVAWRTVVRFVGRSGSGVVSERRKSQCRSHFIEIILYQCCRRRFTETGGTLVLTSK